MTPEEEKEREERERERLKLRRLRSAEDEFNRQRLFEEYEHLRSFGKTHERACQELGVKRSTMEANLRRADKRGEPLPPSAPYPLS